MARAAYLISIHPGRIEGIGLEAGVPQPDTAVVHRSNGDGGDNSAEGHPALSAFFDEAGWESRNAHILLDSENIRLRRLKFPFGNPKKIRQVIALELENVLLEPLSELEYDFQIIPRPDGSAEVVVFLVRRDLLEGVLAECSRHDIHPFSVTFSAEALTRSLADSDGPGFLVYAGDDEVFAVCYTGDGVHALRSVTRDAIKDMAAAAELIGQDAPPPSSTEPGASAEEPQADTATLQAEPLLAPIKDQFNRFIRTHLMGDNPPTVNIMGRFAHLFRWDPSNLVLEATTAVPRAVYRNPNAPSGVLNEFRDSLRTFLSTRGVNFSRRRLAWINQIRQVRGPLTVLAGLGTIVIVLALTLLILDAQRQGQRLDSIQTRMAAIIRQHVPRASTTQAGLQVMKERVADLKQSLALSSRFTDYHYDVLTLLKELSGVYKDFPNASMDSVKLSGNRLTISGKTGSYQLGEDLRIRLAGLTTFANKEVTITHQRSPQGITYRVTAQ